MFVLTALVYPCVLTLLCTGTGLLADRASGGWLPGALVPVVGAATLIAVSQLTAYAAFAAPATPYALAAVSIAGLALGWRRLARSVRDRRRHRWPLAAGVLAYVIALAPVLAAGRPTFSSFGILNDSAFHMLGADYLMRHGQDYAGLDLTNSYGKYLHAYYATGYPSGADTLFGGSAFLLGLPLIWAFQPFNAFMLALATGPAWALARRIGLHGGWAGLAALSATVPALVYGYELVASVKEIVALSMILALGALVAAHACWLRGRAQAGIPFALALAGGVSALGVGFGVWGLAAAVVLGAIAFRDVRAGRQRAGQLLALVTCGAAVLLVAALSTWSGLSASLHAAQGIATTSGTGNLHGQLQAIQAAGTWLVGSYLETPSGGLGVLSYLIAALTLAAAVLGAMRIVYLGEYALAGWIALTIAASLVLGAYATAWVGAKAIVLIAPIIVLLAWAGVAALRGMAWRGRWARAGAIGLTFALAGGIAVSDAMQYHAANLAPTARYDELASIDARYAGKGPTLYVNFDEYALYQLRDMDVGGVSFMYPIAGIRLEQGHGYPVDLDRVPAAVLAQYPLIVTDRDPQASEPPSAYRLAWQGHYYEVWQRRPRTAPALAHEGLPDTRTVPCASVRRLAQIAGAGGARLVAARPPETVTVDIAHARHPAWRYTHTGLELSRAGRLEATFALPSTGTWQVWLTGELMPAVTVSVDGHELGSIAGQLEGNPHNPETMPPLHATLSGGPHRLTIARAGAILAPGEGGWAILHEVVLTPADRPDVDTLEAVSPAQWRSLCGHRYDWIEAVRGSRIVTGSSRRVLQ